jgi:hypothetical protein
MPVGSASSSDDSAITPSSSGPADTMNFSDSTPSAAVLTFGRNSGVVMIALASESSRM